MMLMPPSMNRQGLMTNISMRFQAKIGINKGTDAQEDDLFSFNKPTHKT